MWLGELWACVCLIAFHFLFFHSCSHSFTGQTLILYAFIEGLPHPLLSAWHRGGRREGGGGLLADPTLTTRDAAPTQEVMRLGGRGYSCRQGTGSFVIN